MKCYIPWRDSTHSPVWHRTAESVLSQKRNTNSFSVEDDISGLKRNRKYVIGFVSWVNAIRAVWDNWILLSKPNLFPAGYMCLYIYVSNTWRTAEFRKISSVILYDVTASSHHQLLKLIDVFEKYKRINF